MSVKDKLLIVTLVALITGACSAGNYNREMSEDRIKVELYDFDLGNSLIQRDNPDPNIEVEGVQYGVSGRELKSYRDGDIITIHFDQLEEEDPNIPNMDLIFNLDDFRRKNPLRLGKTFGLNEPPEPDGSKIIVRCNAVLGEDRMIRILSLLFTMLKPKYSDSNSIINPMHAFEIYMDITKQNEQAILEGIVRGMSFRTFQIRFGNSVIAAALVEKPSKILERLHNLVDENSVITPFLNKFAASLLLLLDPDLLLNHCASFYAFTHVQDCWTNDFIKKCIYDNQGIRKPGSPIEMIKSLTSFNDPELYAEDIIAELYELKDNLSSDEGYTGDKAEVIKNIEAAIEYNIQQIASRGGV